MAAPKTYRDYAPLIVGRRALKGRMGARLVGGITLLFDFLAEGLAQAVRAWWIGDPSGIGPAYDALGAAGRELSWPRYPGESWSSYHARLQRAPEDWERAGVETSIRSQLEAFGLGGIEFKYQGVDGWDWDSAAIGTWEEGVGGDDNYTRFWVVITEHPWSGEGVWGDEQEWGDGGVWGLTATPEEIETVRAIIQKLKPGHWINPWIIIVVEPGDWSGAPDGTWHDWRNRDEGARYVDGKGQLPVVIP